MLNKYLNSNPISWLLEDDNQAVKYLTKKYILGNADSNDYNSLENYTPVRKILDKSKNGILGNLKQFDAYYSGSMWLFSKAVYLGLDIRHEIIKKTAEAIIDISQLPSGGFSVSSSPKTADAFLTGLMTGYLISASYNSTSIESAIKWIKNNQRHDGGWLHNPFITNIDFLKKIMLNKTGNGLNFELNTNIPSCVFASSACMNALILHNINNRHSLNINQAANFFLKTRLFIDKHSNFTPSKIRKNLNTDFSRLSVPFFCQYDILDGLNLMVQSGNFSDKKISEAFNIVINRQNKESKWNLESLNPGMLNVSEEKINKPSKFVTFRMMRLIYSIK